LQANDLQQRQASVGGACGVSFDRFQRALEQLGCKIFDIGRVRCPSEFLNPLPEVVLFSSSTQICDERLREAEEQFRTSNFHIRAISMHGTRNGAAWHAREIVLNAPFW